ncbi:MAG TPA: hypothetical protein VJT31_20125, partial [Rugosimonospora sp.]|nr:hypothetical protein [Rugosimonospora sp.]
MIPDPEIEGFVWPDTEDAAVDTVSTVDGGPLILYTERVERPRPLPQPQPVARIRERIRRARPAWPARRERPAHPQRPVPAELVPAEPVAPRHAAAVEMGRYALAEASRYAVAEWVRRTGAPAGRHSALPGAGWYPVVPLPMTSTYRGRRRAEVVNDWRWPAVAGTVAGASLALAILLIAASPPSHGMAGTPSAGGGGITMVGAGQFG